MQWPSWSFLSRDSWNSNDESSAAIKTTETSAANHGQPSTQLNSWTHYARPSVLIPTAILTSTILFGRRLYILYLKRIPTVNAILPCFWQRRSLLGRVTSVGDGDGFRLFHTPGGRLAGWGWLPWRKTPRGKQLKDQTISIRIAGIDAPETAHFGRPAQVGGIEAHEWLKMYIQGRRVRAYIYKRDHYDRVVARVYIWRGVIRRDIGLEMLKRGLATVYEAKSGAEFGGDKVEKMYRSTEAWASRKRKGIWNREGSPEWESPREFKARTSTVKEQV